MIIKLNFRVKLKVRHFKNIIQTINRYKTLPLTQTWEDQGSLDINKPVITEYLDF